MLRLEKMAGGEEGGSLSSWVSGNHGVGGDGTESQGQADTQSSGHVSLLPSLGFAHLAPDTSHPTGVSFAPGHPFSAEPPPVFPVPRLTSWTSLLELSFPLPAGQALDCCGKSLFQRMAPSHTAPTVDDCRMNPLSFRLKALPLGERKTQN